MSSARGLFVTGTDTGVGKTLVAAALARSFARDGFRVAAMKPVAAGIADGAPMHADVAALIAAANVGAPVSDVNPYAFAPAIAPHIAAAQAGVRIDVARIAAAYARIAACADIVVVEGAGGALVPIGEDADMLDIATALHLPAVLVVGIRLGCLNHAFLTDVAARARGVVIAGWIANRIDPAMAAGNDSVRTLRDRLAAPLLADIGWNADTDAPLRGVAARLWPRQ